METVYHGEQILAIIVRSGFSEPGVHFFTPSTFSQQLGYIHHPTGREIPAHFHNPVPREVHFTQEVLFIRKGRIRVDFYDGDQEYLESRALGAGDVVLLASGGHGFAVLEEVEMIEVKQGPYPGADDKVRFPSADPSDVVVR